MFKLSTHFHFIGINGIGMSGIAKIMKHKGYSVSGCDSGMDHIKVKAFESLGCSVATQHLDPLCNNPSIDVLVYSSDIPLQHPEIIKAQKNNIPVLHRADILATIMHESISIAIAGAHGKTTTTSLIAHILLDNQKNPTIIVGGILDKQQTNAIIGSSNIVVAEADESDRSFLKLPKQYSVVTNIDLEHINCYQNIDDIKTTFTTFINNTPYNGVSVLCSDNEHVRSILSSITAPYLTYGTQHDADFQIISPVCKDLTSSFYLLNNKTGSQSPLVSLSIGGMHNIYNATAAYIIAQQLGLSDGQIITTLATFSGVDRRFTIKGFSNLHHAMIVDDYGHHPTELDCTFKLARANAKGTLIVAFQPQRYTRTHALWDEFVNVFSNADVDHIFITDIFTANETAIDNINSYNLVQAILNKNPHKKITYIPYDQIKSLKHLILPLLTPESVVLLQGAGKINQIAQDLIQSV